jgi:pimeloyl-ACP methyl ester carboxylesterase
MTPKESQFNFKGSEIRFQHRGSGKAVLFIHGFLESLEMWDGIADQLPKAYDPICIDLPGHGRSDSLGYLHRMEDFAECSQQLLKHLGKRKAVLVGHSMGGYAALAMADLFPDSVKGLCLLNSTSKADSAQKKKDRLTVMDLVKQNHKSFIRIAIPGLFRPKNRRLLRPQVNEVKELALQTPKQGVLAAVDGMRRRPSREILLKFSPYPVLFIIGKHDPVIPFSQYESQLKQSEQVSALILEESGHMSHIEEREACLNGIASFARKSWN